jgi:hypothetical protein
MSRGPMKRVLVALLFAAAVAAALPAQGATLPTAASIVIPAETQQIINVDYRKMNNAPSALALKHRVLPDTLKQFEQALRGVGINTDTDVESLTFASFRSRKELRALGIAQGNLSRAKVLRQLRLKKIKGESYRNATLYPMAGGMEMVFLDDNTLLFGDRSALHIGLDTRDSVSPGLSSNTEISTLIANVDPGTVWSVLDAAGTQHMLRQSLGDAARLADYETLKKRIQGSYYNVDFEHGVDFDLTVLTSDAMTATTLSSVVQAGMWWRQQTAASGTEKQMLESTKVESDSDKLRVHFKADDKHFQSLLNSDLFTAVSR